MNIDGIRTIDVLYRVSTRAQEAEGESLFNQRRSVEEGWAIPNGITVRRRIEIAESGKSALRLDVGGFRWDRRLEYAQLLTAYQRGDRPDAVCVDWVDRWSRNSLEYLGIIQAFRSLGIRLIAVGDQLDLTDVRNDLLGTIRAGVAQEQLRLTSEKVKESRRSRRERGKWQGGAPPDGFRTHEPDCGGNVQIERESADGSMRSFSARACNCSITTLRRDSSREATICEIWRLLESSPLSWQAMADEINARGYTRPDGKPFRWNDLYRIGENPHYAGVMTTNRWVRDCNDGSIKRRRKLRDQDLVADSGSITNAYISIETFWEIHTRRFDKHTRSLPRAKNGSTSELTGLLMCPSCGRQMSSSLAMSSKKTGHGNPRLSPPKRYAYMGCSAARDRKPVCVNRQRVRVDRVSELLIAKLFETCSIDDDVIATAVKLRRSRGDAVALEAERKRQVSSLETARAAPHHLTRLLASGALSQPEVEELLFAHRRDAIAAETRIREIDSELESQHLRLDFSRARSTLKWLHDSWSKLTVAERAETLRLLISAATYEPNGATIVDTIHIVDYGRAFIEPATKQLRHKIVS